MYEEINIKKSVKKQFDLTGKKALITGGAGFLGFQFAESIAEMGGVPLLVDNNEQSLNEAEDKLRNILGGTVETYLCDISNELNCKEILDNVWSRNNGIDILINSAALTKSGIEDLEGEFFAPFEDTDPHLWDVGMKINLTSIQTVCKIIGKKMVGVTRCCILIMGFVWALVTMEMFHGGIQML